MAGVTSDLGSSRQDFPRGSCEPRGCPAAWRVVVMGTEMGRATNRVGQKAAILNRRTRR